MTDSDIEEKIQRVMDCMKPAFKRVVDKVFEEGIADQLSAVLDSEKDFVSAQMARGDYVKLGHLIAPSIAIFYVCSVLKQSAEDELMDVVSMIEANEGLTFPMQCIPETTARLGEWYASQLENKEEPGDEDT